MSLSPRITLALSCAVYLAAGVLLAGIGPALAGLAAQTGQEVAALGGLFTGVAAGGVLAQFVAGPLGDRLGQRPVLLIGMLVMGGGALGVTLSPSLGLMLACALLLGLGFGGVLAGANVLVAQLFVARSASALNLLNLFFGVGSILGPAISGLGGLWLAAPQAALWLGALLLLAQAPLVPRYAAPAPARSGGAATSLREAAGRPALWMIGLILLVYTGVEIGFGGWVTIYLQRSAALDPAAAAFAATSFWAALTMGRGLGALIGLRLPSRSLLLICLGGIAVGTGLLWLSVGALWPTLLAVALFGLACGPVFPTAIALTTATGGGSASAASLVLAVGNLGGLVIPALLGVLITGRGPAAGAALLVGAALAMLALYGALALGARQLPAPAPECAD